MIEFRSKRRVNYANLVDAKQLTTMAVTSRKAQNLQVMLQSTFRSCLATVVIAGWLSAINYSRSAPVALQNGTATFSQDFAGISYSVDKAIDGIVVSEGWAIAPSATSTLLPGQTAVFETVNNVGSATGAVFTIRVSHAHNNPGHNLGRFRVSVTTDDRSLFADGLDSGGDVSANWVVLDPVTYVSANGSTLTKLADLSILASGVNPATDMYTITAHSMLAGITGFRIEAIEDASLPFGGPGRYGENGNFVVSEFEVEQSDGDVQPPPVATNCVMAASGLVSWWKGENSPGDVADGNPGTHVGNAAYAAGKVGDCFQLDGSGDYIRIGNPTNLRLQNFTIEAWIKRTSSSIVSFGTAGAAVIVGYGQGGYALVLGSDGRPSLSMIGVSGVAATTTIIDTNFHHLAVTKSGSTVVFYVDGVAFPATAYNPSFTFATSLAIGARADNGDNSFFGSIDEASIYNRALSAGELAAIRNASSKGKCSEPPIIVTHPLSQKITVGSNVNFSVVAIGTPPLRYQWSRDNQPLPGNTNDSINLVALDGLGGNYSVRVTNLFGFAVSSNAVLTLNHPPVADSQSLVVNEDGTLPVALTGSDTDGDGLSFSIVAGPTNGAFDGISYKPFPNYYGPDSIVFKVNDGMVDSGMATVGITVMPVNDAPFASGQSVVVDEDTPVSILLAGGDVDGDAISFVVGVPAHGTLTGVAPNLVYVPSTNHSGIDAFTFMVNDGQTNSTPATVSILIRPVNDAPIARIAVLPQDEFPGVTNLVVVSSVCCPEMVILDGADSSDPENDPLTYLWLEGTNVLGSAIAVTNQFRPGTHEITLVVNDGSLAGTNKIQIEVVTPEEAIGFILGLLEESCLPPRKASAPKAWLNTSARAFERCQLSLAVRTLQMLQSRVAVTISPENPELGGEIIASAQTIIESVSDCPKCNRWKRRSCHHVHSKNCGHEVRKHR